MKNSEGSIGDLEVKPTKYRHSAPKTEAQLEAVAKALQAGKSLKASLKAGGFSDTVAANGMSGMSKRLLRHLAKQGVHLAALGKSITPDEQENIVRGRLLWNAATGVDNAVRSAELLGKDKRVNMFASDAVAGLIVLQMPQAITEGGSKAGGLPVLEAEIIEDQPKLPETT